MRKFKKQQGFTLIELIIYLGIVSIILVSMSYLIIDIMSGQARTNAREDVNQNIRFISQTLAKDIRTSQDISSLTTSLTLTMPGDDIIYTFVPGTLILTRQLGANPAVTVNSNRVEVIGSFTDQSFAARNKNVGVNLTVSYKNPDNLLDYNASTVSNFSVEVRGRR